MATLDEPIICQRLSEYERKGSMDGKWQVLLAAVSYSAVQPQNMMKNAAAKVCVCVCMCVYISSQPERQV